MGRLLKQGWEGKSMVGVGKIAADLVPHFTTRPPRAPPTSHPIFTILVVAVTRIVEGGFGQVLGELGKFVNFEAIPCHSHWTKCPICEMKAAT